MAGKTDEARKEQEEMAHTEDLPENVIHINFGQPRPAKETPQDLAELAPYDADLIPEDPLAVKKYGIFCKYVDNGMVSVTLDPRQQGVSVPKHFADRSDLVLNFSHRFFIEDFSYDEVAICASLSFSGRPHYCIVPWGAVKMLLSHHDNAVAVFDADVLF